MLLDNRLFLAPIGPEPQKVLDIGTGTGIWAIDFADAYPSASVIGTDLSPIQPTHVPPNVQFEIDDCTDEWAYLENSFDFIHVRGLFGSLRDWPAFYKQVYDHLKPGGWYEQLECSVDCRADDDSTPPGSPCARWGELFTHAFNKLGKPVDVLNHQYRWLREAGFEDVHEERFKMPIGLWPSAKTPFGRKMKEIGRWRLLEVEAGMEGWALALFTRVLGMSYQEVQLYLSEMRKSWSDRRVHSVTEVGVVYALRAQAYEEEMTIHVDADARKDDEQLDDEQPARPVLKDITEANSSPAIDDNTATSTTSDENARATKTDTSEDNGDTTTGNESEQEQPTVQGLSQRDGSGPRGLSSSSKTPKFDPEIHAPAEREDGDDDEARDDSFVDSIKSRSPTKLSRESAQPDSFLQDITSRTPLRASSRIEDSVEAIDALEDAIEQVAGILPKLDHLNLESPVKLTKKTPEKQALSALHEQTKNTTPVACQTPLDQKRLSKTSASASAKKPLPSSLSKQSKTTTPAKTQTEPLPKAKPAKRASTAAKLPSKPTTVMAQAAPKTVPQREPRTQLSFSNSPLKQQQQTNTKKRATSGPLSTSRPGFVPAKSTKAPTRSNFSLPGEAIAAKIKAQREERAKKEEEEKSRQSFKARPAPPTTSRPSLAPRENRASQARMSAIRSGSNKENVTPRQVPATVSNPASSITVNKTRPDANKANSSIRRTTLPPKPTSTAPRASIGPRVSSLAAGQKLAVTKEDAAQQKAKGKEVFGPG
ncbi:hypothetical protein DV738_g4377, partial [Chaetothyriales sp. CBS 135597]